MSAARRNENTHDNNNANVTQEDGPDKTAYASDNTSDTDRIPETTELCAEATATTADTEDTKETESDTEAGTEETAAPKKRVEQREPSEEQAAT